MWAKKIKNTFTSIFFLCTFAYSCTCIQKYRCIAIHSLKAWIIICPFPSHLPLPSPCLPIGRCFISDRQLSALMRTAPPAKAAHGQKCAGRRNLDIGLKGHQRERGASEEGESCMEWVQWEMWALVLEGWKELRCGGGDWALGVWAERGSAWESLCAVICRSSFSWGLCVIRKEGAESWVRWSAGKSIIYVLWWLILSVQYLLLPRSVCDQEGGAEGWRGVWGMEEAVRGKLQEKLSSVTAIPSWHLVSFSTEVSVCGGWGLCTVCWREEAHGKSWVLWYAPLPLAVQCLLPYVCLSAVCVSLPSYVDFVSLLFTVITKSKII